MKTKFHPLLLFLIVLLTGCNNQGATTGDAHVTVKTPVRTSSVVRTSISEGLTLNATSTFLKKNEIKAPVSGYAESLKVSLGQVVRVGSLLFTIRTKEAEALSHMQEKDSLFGAGGQIPVVSPVAGIVTSINTQIHTYVSEADPMAIIADRNSFVFILHVPYEWIDFTKTGTKCRIMLPGGNEISGTITSRLSDVDAASQTQSFIISTASNPSLPENLIVTVELEKSIHTNTQVVDKACVLSDETMENFWVMKLVNDSTAIKVPVTRGISRGDRIEILTPLFNPGERLVSSGNYGLPDTARVVIIK